MKTIKNCPNPLQTLLRVLTGITLAAALAACSNGNGNNNSSTTQNDAEPDQPIADVNPFQELVDQGVTRYLGAYTPMLSETEGDIVSHRFSASDGPMCLRGGEYVMSTRDLGSEDLVIFLQGGGGCWDTLCAATETAAPGIPKAGILDNDLPGNPIADMNMAYLPYCDGGVHASDAEYDIDENGIIEPGTTDQFHHGLHNLSAALDVTVQAFPAPRRIVLMGVSGGGFGTIFALPLVRTLYPDIPIDVVNDSGVSVGRPNEPEFFKALLSYWNIADSFIPDSCPQCIADDGHGTGVHNWGLDRDENLRISLLSHKQDSTIANFFFGVGGAAWETELVREMGEVEAASPDRARSLIADGSAHTFLIGKTAAEVDGITVLDWVAAMLDDSPQWTSRID
ncbi:Uncharacterised protein [Halioglobus japonicus]|nr:Uncharacterised protein [Halioglobus japonicus]